MNTSRLVRKSALLPTRGEGGRVSVRQISFIRNQYNCWTLGQSVAAVHELKAARGHRLCNVALTRHHRHRATPTRSSSGLCYTTGDTLEPLGKSSPYLPFGGSFMGTILLASGSVCRRCHQAQMPVTLSLHNTVSKLP